MSSGAAWAAAGLALVGVVVSAAGCGDSGTLYLEWPEQSAPLAFLAWLEDEALVPRPTGSAFSVEPESSPTQRLDVVHDADLLLALLPDTAWTQAGLIPHPEVTASAGLARESETCPRGRFSQSPEAPVVRHDAEPLVTVYRASMAAEEPRFLPADPALFAGFSFSARVEPNTCAPFDANQWIPWDPSAPRPIDRSVTAKDLIRLSEDRLIVTTASALFLVERGRAFVDEPERVFDLAAYDGLDPTSIRVLVRTRLRASTETSESRSVYAGVKANVAGGEFAAVLEFIIGPAGIAQVTTSTQFPGQLEDLMVLPEGDVFALASERSLVTARTRGAFLISRVGPNGPWLRRDLSHNRRGLVLHNSVDPREPHAIGFEDGTTQRGDLRTPAELKAAETIFLGGGRNIIAMSSEMTPLGPRHWAASDVGAFASLEPQASEWRLVHPPLPPSVHRCSSTYDECGRLVNISPAGSLTFSPALGELLLSLEMCDTMLALRTEDHCVRGLPVSAESPADMGTTPVFSVDQSGVLMIAGDGTIAEWQHR